MQMSATTKPNPKEQVSGNPLQGEDSASVKKTDIDRRPQSKRAREERALAVEKRLKLLEGNNESW